MDKKTLITIITIFLFLFTIIIVFSRNLSINELPQTGDENSLNINSFEECIEAGFPLLESYPPKCLTSDGILYTQDISQIANPASEYCIEMGGRIEFRKDLQGEAGFCIFENGKECEEWSFFNGECKN